MTVFHFKVNELTELDDNENVNSTFKPNEDIKCKHKDANLCEKRRKEFIQVQAPFPLGFLYEITGTICLVMQ